METGVILLDDGAFVLPAVRKADGSVWYSDPNKGHTVQASDHDAVNGFRPKFEFKRAL
jgi:hypothetical protein